MIKSPQSHDVGFAWSIDPYDARRQWTMSLALVIALCVAIVTAFATVGVHPISSHANPVISAQGLVVHPAEAANRNADRVPHLPSRS